MGRVGMRGRGGAGGAEEAVSCSYVCALLVQLVGVEAVLEHFWVWRDLQEQKTGYHGRGQGVRAQESGRLHPDPATGHGLPAQAASTPEPELSWRSARWRAGGGLAEARLSGSGSVLEGLWCRVAPKQLTHNNHANNSQVLAGFEDKIWAKE